MRWKTLIFGVALLAIVISACCATGSFGQGQAVITLDPGTTDQTIIGWEATDYFFDWPGHSASYPLFLDDLYDKTANDLGINRVRLEIRSGTESSVDAWELFENGQIDEAQFESYYGYNVENDNSDPLVINPNGFHYAGVDHVVEGLILPLKQRLETKGEQLYLNLCYVGGCYPYEWECGPVNREVHRDPDEYAEFILAVFLYMQDKYGFVPDGVEVSLEPEVFGTFSARQMGDNLVAAAVRLAANGFAPDFIAPSNTSTYAAINYFDDMIQVPGVLNYLTEFSYHLYSGNDNSARQQIWSRAQQYGLRTAMNEHIGSPYQDLHNDLKIAMNCSWAQMGLAGGSSWFCGGDYYGIDETDPDNPQVIICNRTKFYRQYFKFIRRGAVRIGASSSSGTFDPLAFINPDGKFVVVVNASGGGDFAIQGLPAGTYGIKYTTGDGQNVIEYDVDLPDATISSGQALSASIPASGVITVYAKALSTPTPPTGVTISGPTTGLVQVGYPFTATVSPITATLPITYVWQASGQSPVTNTADLSDVVTFTWSTTGSQTITVTAMNAGGTVSDTHATAIVTTPTPTPPTGVVISGPPTGFVQVGYPFTATVSPVTATLPITYIWQASGQSPVTNTGGLSDVITFTWSTTGSQTITVTAMNAGGMVSDTHATAIVTTPTPTPPTGVTISGPPTGLVQVGYPFTATVSPVTATLPITDIWQATGQSPVTNTSGLSDTVTFTWSVTGSQTITVTAMNAGGAAVGSHFITIIPGYKIYLPLILRSWS